MERKNRFNRKSWNNDLLHDSAQLSLADQQIDFNDMNNMRNPITIELDGYRYSDKNSGFVIAFGKLLSEPNGIPNEWKVRLNKNKLIIKGSSLKLVELDAVGTLIECSGSWIVDPKFGLQYQFDWIREAMPTSTEALMAYLGSHKIKGIGPAIAKKIVDKWGKETLNILDNSPEKLKEISGMTDKKIDVIKKEWKNKKQSYELVSFFGQYGIGEVWVPKIVESLGETKIKSRVKDNPYLLSKIEGIGFITADKIALSMGIERTDIKRCEAMLKYILNDYTQKMGYTACPTNEWFSEAVKKLGLSANELQPIAQKLINEHYIVLRNIKNSENKVLPCVSSYKEYEYEKYIALHVAKLSKNQELSQNEKLIMYQELSDRYNSLDSSQLESVFGIFDSQISILTGGPGTGKTTTLKSVVDIAEKMSWRVVLAAPTGRAAKRMEDAIGRSAGTIHRVLQYNPREGFFFNKNNKLKADLFIVDESSMLDNSLAFHWLQAIPENSKVMFVGDVDQLPSVGPGNFLRDLIHSKASRVFTLNYIHRQTEGSLIAENAKKVLKGKLPDENFNINNDFSWCIPSCAKSNVEINTFFQKTIIDLVKSLLKKGYRKNDIQIISPQKEGDTGINQLNILLRDILNESKLPLSLDDNNQFALGDRLLVTKNNYSKNIFNGDMGIVENISDNGDIDLTMENGDKVSLESSDKKILTLGYAITVHKSQGGEKPIIIMPCSPSHTYSMNKNLIYTGITRGKDKVFLFGTKKTLSSVLRKEEKIYRMTGLKQEIQRAIKFIERQNKNKRKSKIALK